MHTKVKGRNELTNLQHLFVDLELLKQAKGNLRDRTVGLVEKNKGSMVSKVFTIRNKSLWVMRAML